MLKALPNIMTGLRLLLCLAMFAALAAAGWGLRHEGMSLAAGFALCRFAFAAVVVAAVTDFLDGWLARRYDATSLLGAILDPIADKILVCGAILGLMAVEAEPSVMLPGGIILFREFAVSALREVLAPRGVKLPVTFLAKTKTALQLFALAAVMFVRFWPAWGLPLDFRVFRQAELAAHMVLWLAALVTVWTGIEYALSARKALARG